MPTRNSNSETNSGRRVVQSSRPDPSAEVVCSSPEVDSRAYAFAYLTSDPTQLPADFPVDQTFEHALFLPQEIVPRFKTPRYIPRLILEGRDNVMVYSHPRCAPTKTTIPFGDISHIEVQRFLADCSLIISTPGKVVHLPFHGRDREYVQGFLKSLKGRLLPHNPQANFISESQEFGPTPNYKFEQIEAILEVDRKSIMARFFVPPKEVIRPRLLRNEISWKFGSEIVLTRTELHVFSDDKDGYRQLYGFRASWAPLQQVVALKWEKAMQSVTIRLSGDFILRIPAPEELEGEAERFANFASHEVLDCRAT
jgi:hypothetical protein